SYIMEPDRESSAREFATYLRTQAATVKSRFVLNAALKKDEVRNLPFLVDQPDPLLVLEEELAVETGENSEFITVRMMGDDPGPLITVINAVTKAYLDEVIQADLKRKSERLAKLDKLRIQLDSKARQKKDTFRKLADQLGTIDTKALSDRQSLLEASLGDLRRQFNTVRFDLLRADSRLKTHKAREAELDRQPVTEAEIMAALEGDPSVKQLLQQINDIDRAVTEYKDSAIDPYETSLIRAQQRLNAKKKELSALVAKKRDDVVKVLRTRGRLEWEAALANLQRDHDALVSQRDALSLEMENTKETTRTVQSSSTEMEMLRSEIAQEDKALARVMDEQHVLRIELDAPPRVQPFQEAGVSKKDTKRLMVALVVGPVGVFVAVCLLVAYFEFRGRRIQTTDEVIDGLGMRVVGSLPVLAPPAQRRLLTANAEAEQGMAEHCLLESIDSIRTLLLKDASVEATRVVMVTSAVGGEGKTTLASHLAGSLARAGRKTLLIDCDLRSPTAHQLFEQAAQPGFSEVLLGEVHMAEAIRSTAVDGLWLLPAGQWDREVMAALARDGLDEVFDKLKSDYDFIIVDSHPVLAATDSLLIGQYTDAVLLSLLRDVSQAPRVYAACQRLGTLGIRILGTVVHGMQQEEVFTGGYTTVAAA
ncbi:MAG: polysaccharide biosynthesis tyrosine autokinase, partial [Planctomycetia bacterium]|nr:polysaccharide biosynthesis tyrosine autokinase [Planctomycetia bacterium]